MKDNNNKEVYSNGDLTNDLNAKEFSTRNDVKQFKNGNKGYRNTMIFLALLIFGVVLGVFITENNKSNKSKDNITSSSVVTMSSHRKYINSESNLEEGKVLARDSNGNLYETGLEVDTDYYASLGENPSYAQSSGTYEKTKNTMKYKQFIVNKLSELASYKIDDFVSYEETKTTRDKYTHYSIDAFVKINSLSSEKFRLLAIVNDVDNSELWITLLDSQNQEVYVYNTTDKEKVLNTYH